MKLSRCVPLCNLHTILTLGNPARGSGCAADWLGNASCNDQTQHSRYDNECSAQNYQKPVQCIDQFQLGIIKCKGTVIPQCDFTDYNTIVGYFLNTLLIPSLKGWVAAVHIHFSVLQDQITFIGFVGGNVPVNFTIQRCNMEENTILQRSVADGFQSIQTDCAVRILKQVIDLEYDLLNPLLLLIVGMGYKQAFYFAVCDQKKQRNGYQQKCC